MEFLSSGDELISKEAEAIKRDFGAKLIVIAGESDSGKTTVLSCVHEIFRDGSYAGYLFARSRTLPAFERVCHDSRAESGRQTPETERTSMAEGIRFFHLGVRHESLKAPTQHLLISNISGEAFREIRSSSNEALKMDFIKSADHFALVIDGAQLAKPAKRALARSHSQKVLRRLIEEGLLDKSSQVDVLFSKWDCLDSILKSTTDKPHLQEFLADFEAQLRRFEGDLGRLRFFQIAARPPSSNVLKEGHGLEKVFRSWVEESAVEIERPSTTGKNVSPRRTRKYVSPQSHTSV